MQLKEDSTRIIPIDQWLHHKSKPLIISGPCSAESREQVLATAERLYNTGVVSAFRSGLWKPRTRPGAFEGHGENALQWLVEVKEKYGFPLVVEVATPRHIEACLKAGIDIFWIGARTSVNPFSVQELAEALKGVDIPVMVKNPLNPDLSLWVGVIERFILSGITRIAAIHRGFNTWEKTRFRNDPLWDIPIKLKSIFPKLPILCDPSHIAGKRDLLLEVAQKALLLDMDGFMIETHFDPDNALTDAAQQITPEKLQELISKLDVPLHSEENPCRDIDHLRNRIDDLDSSLIGILSKRMEMVQEIAKIKKDCKMTVLQINRWNSIVEARTEEAMKLGLNEPFVRSMLDLIHKESIDVQSKIIS
jgi:chorismate mutase